VPFARDALELGAPTVLEVHAGAGGEVPDDAGDEHLAGSALRRDPGADMDRDSFHLVADELHHTRMDARPDIEAEVADGADRAAGTGDKNKPVVTLCPYVVGDLSGSRAIERMQDVSEFHDGLLVPDRAGDYTLFEGPR
jgi:hypothetical protein